MRVITLRDFRRPCLIVTRYVHTVGLGLREYIFTLVYFYPNLKEKRDANVLPTCVYNAARARSRVYYVRNTSLEAQC